MSLAYQYISQTNPPYNAEPGTTYDCSITLKNTGTETWSQNGSTPVRLGTQQPQDGASSFYPGNNTAVTGWVNDHRIQIPNDVASNATVTIPFQVKAPNRGGRFKQYLRPLKEGVAWMSDAGMYVTSCVPAPVGIFKFGWYKSNYRWDQSSAYSGYAIDTPSFGTISGKYASDNATVINQQLQICSDMGFDYVVLDYWLDNNTNGDPDYAFIQSVAEATITEIHTNFPNLKYAFLIEPPAAGTPPPTAIPAATYNSIYSAHGTDPQFQTWDDPGQGSKPLLFTFLNRTPGAGDSRFNIVAMGTGNTPNYSNWNANPADLNGRSHLSISHRFDRQHYAANVPPAYNVSLDENVFAKQCGYALTNRDSIQVLTYTALNEHYERTNAPEVSANARAQITAFNDAWKKI